MDMAEHERSSASFRNSTSRRIINLEPVSGTSSPSKRRSSCRARSDGNGEIEVFTGYRVSTTSRSDRQGRHPLSPDVSLDEVTALAA